MAIVYKHVKGTDTTYVYESESYWVPEIGQSRSKRKLIGKLDPETGNVVPCGKRGPKKKDKSEQIRVQESEELRKMQEKYLLSQEELAKVKIELSETKKKISDLTKQNQKQDLLIKKIKDLVL